MDHAPCVRRSHPSHGWQEQSRRFADAEESLARNIAGEGLTLEQLHHDARHPRMLDDVEDRNHIGMVHQAGGQNFAVKEALRQAGRGQGPQNDLQGDSLARSFVRSRPHRSHSASPDQVLDPVFSSTSWPARRIVSTTLSGWASAFITRFRR